MNRSGSLKRTDIFFDNTPIPFPKLEAISTIVPSSTFTEPLRVNWPQKPRIPFVVETNDVFDARTAKPIKDAREEKNPGEHRGSNRRRRTYGPATRTSGSGLRDRSQIPSQSAVNTTVLDPKTSKVTKSSKPHGRAKIVVKSKSGNVEVLPPSKPRGRPRKLIPDDQVADEEPNRGARPNTSEKSRRKDSPPVQRRGRSVSPTSPLTIGIAMVGTFRFGAFTIVTQAKNAEKKFRVKVNQPFQMVGDRISFEFEELDR